MHRRPVRQLMGALALLASLSAGSFAFGGTGVGAELQPTDIEDIRVESPGYQAALAAVDVARNDIAWARQEIDRNEHLIEQLESGARQLEAGLPTLESRIDSAAELVEEARADLADLAVLQYVVRGSTSGSLPLTHDARELSEPRQREFIMDTAIAGHAAVLETAERRRADAVGAVDTARLGRTEIAARLSAARDALATARSVLSETSSRLPHLEDAVANERRRTRVVGSDLSYVAVDAYLNGARTANRSHPGCRLDWTLLAGIGRVESRHGTYGGTSLGDDGRVGKPIIGIALNGSRETAVVTDSDGGALDGDAVFDRAVGPMQFIPTTWRHFAVDGNGDGVADPQNIYDAAVAAGNYLCRSGDLSVAATLERAILTYNNSDVYVRAVLQNADTYAELGIRT